MKPSADDEVSIGSMGFQTDAENADSDTFTGNYEDIVKEDQASLFILCKFGPDSRGKYTESILSMFDYKMLCKNQKTDFCSCNEEKLYQVKDGEFMKYDKNGNSKVTAQKQSSNMAIALIIASTAVVLVAVAIILVVILFICKFRRAS